MLARGPADVMRAGAPPTDETGRPGTYRAVNASTTVNAPFVRKH